MKSIKGFIVDTDYVNVDDKTFIQLFGRLENGESFVVLNRFEPYFFIKENDKTKAKSILEKFNVNPIDLKNFQGEKVLKISGKNQEETNKVLKELHEKEIATYEGNLKPSLRFMMDLGIRGGIEITGDYESSERVNRIYRDAEIKPCVFSTSLKVLSIDIESGKKDNELYCIGMYGLNFEKSFMVTKEKIPGVISCKDAEECLIKFKQEVIDFDPDIITGWNFISFDLLYLQTIFREHKLTFDIGRTNDNLRLKIEKNYFKSSSARVVGRQMVDGLSFIRDPFIQEAPSIKSAKFESYTLENVSQQILGKGKLLKGEGRHDEIQKLYESKDIKDLKKLIDYNLMDCQLVYEILEKTKMIDLAVERTQLTGMTIDRLTASIAAFDSVYIREARKRKLVSPDTIFGNKESKLKGGYVYSENSGIFHNVVILDFKSLYPSIIRTFNIDPSSYLGKSPGKEKEVIETPNKAYFKNQEGILPAIIHELHLAREKAKKEKRELSSYAIKIIMNSFWGVLASPNCRYFDFDMASSITAFAREIIQLTAKKIEEKGFNVIYSDTDSVFVETGLGKEKANKAGIEIQEYINEFYKKYVKEKYNRTSFLELEFQKQYLSMMIPSLRLAKKAAPKGVPADGGNAESSTPGAKKRYAGLIEKNGKETLEVVGLEAIRGDWTEAAQEFQKELLMRVFQKQEIDTFIKDYIKKINDGKIDSKLLYRKSIRKGLDEYTKTTPPHVKAARKLGRLDSNIIEYFITTDGPEPIQKVTHKLDYEHYIEKQIKPIAEQVLVLFKKKFDDLMNGSKQKTLF